MLDHLGRPRRRRARQPPLCAGSRHRADRHPADGRNLGERRDPGACRGVAVHEPNSDRHGKDGHESAAQPALAVELGLDGNPRSAHEPGAARLRR